MVKRFKLINLYRIKQLNELLNIDAIKPPSQVLLQKYSSDFICRFKNSISKIQWTRNQIYLFLFHRACP